MNYLILSSFLLFELSRLHIREQIKVWNDIWQNNVIKTEMALYLFWNKTVKLKNKSAWNCKVQFAKKSIICLVKILRLQCSACKTQGSFTKVFSLFYGMVKLKRAKGEKMKIRPCQMLLGLSQRTLLHSKRSIHSHHVSKILFGSSF